METLTIFASTKKLRRIKIKNFFNKLVDNILCGILAAGLILVLTWQGWLPGLLDFLPKYFPQYSNYWLITSGVITGILLIVFLMIRAVVKAQEKARYESDVIPIIEDADLKSHTDKQKEAIESILKELNSEITGRPFHKVLGSLQANHKKHFKLALPYIQRYIKEFIESAA